jgi:hypothetical protein
MKDMAPFSLAEPVPDEADLLARMRAGADDAFEACVRAHCDRDAARRAPHPAQ